MWRRWLPRSWRVEAVRLRRLPAWLVEAPKMARRSPAGDAFAAELAAHASPLRRAGAVKDERLQAGKEANVALVASLIDGVVVRPGQTFSYQHVVGRPTRARGFRDGLELHDGKPAAGLGGGACQVANLLYVIAVRGLMNVTERHRHSLDLFPDEGRTVPFGCGATVFYNLADLRFVNPLDTPVVLRLGVRGGTLHGALVAAEDPGLRGEILETDHRFVQEDGLVFRENKLWRRITRVTDGAEVAHHLLAEHRARVCYPVPREAPLLRVSASARAA